MAEASHLPSNNNECGADLDLWRELIRRIESKSEPDLHLARWASTWASKPCPPGLRRAAASAATVALSGSALAIICQPPNEDASISLPIQARMSMAAWLLSVGKAHTEDAQQEAVACLRALLGGLSREEINGVCSATSGHLSLGFANEFKACGWAMRALASLGFEFGAGQPITAVGAIVKLGHGGGGEAGLLRCALGAGATPDAGMLGMLSPLSAALEGHASGRLEKSWPMALIDFKADPNAGAYTTNLNAAAHLFWNTVPKDQARADQCIELLARAGVDWKALDLQGRSLALHAAGNSQWWAALSCTDCGWELYDLEGRCSFDVRLENLGERDFIQEARASHPQAIMKAFSAAWQSPGEGEAPSAVKEKALGDWISSLSTDRLEELRKQWEFFELGEAEPDQAGIDEFEEAKACDHETPLAGQAVSEAMEAILLAAEENEGEDEEGVAQGGAAIREAKVAFKALIASTKRRELDGKERKEHGGKAALEQQPMCAVTTQADLDDFAEDLEAMKDEADVKKLRKVLKTPKSKDFLMNRPLAKAKDLRMGLDRLRSDFPHFAEVIEHISDHCALSEAGDGALLVPPMLLVGGPGVGKTFFFKKVADLVKTEYKVLNMASMTASWIISGSSAQWSGGRPGLIYRAMVDGPTANPIFLLDEIDKCSGGKNYPPEMTLLPLLEHHTASHFKDECIGVRLDASRINWVATANDPSTISAPLMSRMDPFTIRSPNARERRALAQAVYSSLKQGSSWGPKLDELLNSETLDRVCQPLGNGAARDLRRVLTTACAKAVAAGRSEIKAGDLPLAAPQRRQPWDAKAIEAGQDWHGSDEKIVMEEIDRQGRSCALPKDEDKEST